MQWHFCYVNYHWQFQSAGLDSTCRGNTWWKYMFKDISNIISLISILQTHPQKNMSDHSMNYPTSWIISHQKKNTRYSDCLNHLLCCNDAHKFSYHHRKSLPPLASSKRFFQVPDNTPAFSWNSITSVKSFRQLLWQVSLGCFRVPLVVGPLWIVKLWRKIARRKSLGFDTPNIWYLRIDNIITWRRGSNGPSWYIDELIYNWPATLSKLHNFFHNSTQLHWRNGKVQHQNVWMLKHIMSTQRDLPHLYKHFLIWVNKKIQKKSH